MFVVDSSLAMYCPICGVEYRPGFAVCSDCQVALVPDPPNKPPEDASPEGATFVRVWSGTDARQHAEVCESLDREKIPNRTVLREDRLVYSTMQPPFEVYVPAALQARAKAVLKETMLLEGEEERAAESGVLEIPAEDEYPNNDDDSHSERTDWQPEDATVKIWSGQDSNMADMVTASLRENQILYRTGSDVANPASDPEETAPEETAIEIFVLPEDETRGKEIVREIVDAAPPES